MERFPNNSGMALTREKREPEKDIFEPEEKVQEVHTKAIKGTAMKRKAPLGEKIKDTFIHGDISDVFSHIVQDILIPSATDTLRDMGYNLIDGMIYGDDARTRGRSRRNRFRERTSIDRGTGRKSSGNQSYHNRRSLRFDDILVDSEDEANVVICELLDAIDNYHRGARVSDLYRAIGWEGFIDYTTDTYGWRELDGIRAVPVRVDGEQKWMVKLPRAEYLGE